jgi:hypothetical protein
MEIMMELKMVKILQLGADWAVPDPELALLTCPEHFFFSSMLDMSRVTHSQSTLLALIAEHCTRTRPAMIPT